MTLVETLSENGLKLDTEDTESLKESLRKGNFRFLVKDNKPTAFFSWLEIKKYGKLYVWINNLLVWKKTDLFQIRQILRNRYKNIDVEFFYWWSKKRNKYIYGK